MQPSFNRFQSFDLNSNEEVQAKRVNGYFYAYLQNKISEYANAVVEFEFTGEREADIIQHERLKAQVMVLEELLNELTPPIQVDESQQQSQV
jgi:hypothetical protein